VTKAGSLEALASVLGIEIRYRDQIGDTRQVPESTIETLVARLQSTPDDAVVPPVIVRQQNSVLSIPIQGIAKGTGRCRWEIETEGGHRLHGTIEDGADHISLQESPPPGHYRLRLLPDDGGSSIAEHQLIIAPPRAFLPPTLQAGGRLWGLAVQLFAVRSARNWGIGDFTDLAELIDRAAAAGASAIGLNPLHALFPEEPERASPYSPSSRDFLNILYIDPEAIADFAECEAARDLRQSREFQRALVSLRAVTFVDYAGVAAAKRQMFDLLYRQFREQHLAPEDERGGAFRQFQNDAGPALRRFATFHALREHFAATMPERMAWRRWPEPFQRADSIEVASFARENELRIEFFEYLQWQAEIQLRRCAKRARDAGMPIGLYIDIAVGVDADSADAWALQDYLVDRWSVGAPPDEWNLKGQNWGIPPPHPHRMRETAYAAFRQTLRANMRFAGAIRLDHILGFMRLFWIPAGANPADGAYVRYPLTDLLAITALESQRNRCLIIGEDLGTVPEGLREKLRDGGLLSYRLLYFEREEGGAFCAPRAWPDQALVAVTTHDLPTLPGYWDGTDIELKARLDLYPSAERERRDREMRQMDRQQLATALRAEGLEADANGPAPIESIYRYLARTPGELLMVQPEDLLGVREQMNLPGTTNEYPNWRRKLPLDLAALFAIPGAARILAAINAEGRARPEPSATHLQRSAEELALPRATYRLQFNQDLTFAQATRLLPYLRELGISHVYASSYLKARPGSAHGYDITDHNSLNPEIGTAADFERFCEALRKYGMGQILDFIPNHMGIGHADNSWWLDILEWGRASPFAEFFDINWTPRQPALQGKVLLPLLGDQYGQVLERGELKLRFDEETGSFSVWYFEHRFPIRPRHYGSILENALGSPQGTALDADSRAAIGRIVQASPLTTGPDGDESSSAVRAQADEMKMRLAGLAANNATVIGFLHAAAEAFNGRPGVPDSFVALHRLLEQQHYRLAFWRVAADEVNYRRFFDINELAGIRMEQPAVFETTHRLIGRLVAEGKLQGLRLDHVDGLFDPAEYFARLHGLASECAAKASGSRPDGQPFYILVEKILARHEHLRDDWPIAGTTGYEFINLVNGLFVDPAGERPLDRTYRRFLDRSADFDEILHACKTHVIDNILASELNGLAGELDVLSERHWSTRDYTLERLRAALKEVVAGFPVYRTYISARGIAPEDRRYIDWAVSQARKTYTGADPEILDLVHAVLTTDLAEREPVYGRSDVLRFAMRFQQYTGPVMAKSLEDTCFYRYNRLLSLNEVGGDPRQFGVSVSAFHHLMQERAKRWPHALSPSATHDTKRGADVRARLNVMSELTGEWDKRVRRWASLNRYKRQRIDRASAPTPNDEYMIYQTMLGAWPAVLTGDSSPDAAVIDSFRERLQAAVLKSIREAKRRTSWTNPNAVYEDACMAFVTRILDMARPNPFFEDFVGFQARISRLGVLNSLCQSVITLTAPGVPDIYQGGELWDFNLVDPDNRRPVDFEQRRRLLSEVRHILRKPASERATALRALLETWQDGRIKLAVMAALLDCRERERTLFAHGGYQPLEFDGPALHHLLGYARQGHDRTCLVIVGRMFAGLIGDRQAFYPGETLWNDTALVLPNKCRHFEDVLTGRTVAAQGERLALSEILGDLPAAVLLGRVPD
jgi:(1->4)-alpha-D-glucan 1-alpha-D-glucosylmutase